MVKLPHPTLGSICLGRKAPNPNSKKLHLRDYLARLVAINPPASVDYTQAALLVLYNVLRNNVIGCCVISDLFHRYAVVTGNAGALYIPSDAEIDQYYGYIGGYNGTPASDQGCDPETAWNFLVNTGFPNGDKYACWFVGDATNVNEMKTGLYLLENASGSVCLPDAWLNPAPQASGFVWGIAGPPNPNNGHEVSFVGYTAQGVIVDSWGMLGIITWGALAQYFVPSAGGAVYFTPTQAMINKATGKAPNGLDWATLVADFDALGGNVPVPTPAPSPPSPAPPAPSPSPAPTPVGEHVVSLALGTDIRVTVDFSNPAKPVATLTPDLPSWLFVPANASALPQSNIFVLLAQLVAKNPQAVSLIEGLILALIPK